MELRGFKFADSAEPAAGADFSITVPTGEVWRIISVAGFLQASAAAANREVALNIDQGGATVSAYLLAGVNHIATEGRIYTWGAGLGFRGAGSTSQHLVIGIPIGLIVTGGGRIRSITTNIQAGDDWNVARAFVEVWS